MGQGPPYEFNPKDFMRSPSKLRAMAGPAALALILVTALYLVTRVYAAGDACLEHKFTHTADASARIAVLRILRLKRHLVRLIPILATMDTMSGHMA